MFVGKRPQTHDVYVYDDDEDNNRHYWADKRDGRAAGRSSVPLDRQETSWSHVRWQTTQPVLCRLSTPFCRAAVLCDLNSLSDIYDA